MPRSVVSRALVARALGVAACGVLPCLLVGLVYAQALRAWARGTRTVVHVLAAVDEAHPAAPVPPPASHAPATARRARRASSSVAAPPDPADMIESVRAVLCTEAAHRACRARTRCGCVEPAPDCEARVEAACSDMLVTAFGRTSFPLEVDPDALARCIRGFDAIGDRCNLDVWSRDCEWPLREPVEIGERCEGDRGCRGGWCHDGLCVARVARGRSLEAAQMCASGLVGTGAGTCEPRLIEGASCSSHTECVVGLDCIHSRCAHPGERGASCSTSSQCDVGLACTARSYGRRRAPGHCVEPTSRWCEPGDSCGMDSECRVVRDRCVPCEGECSGPSLCDDGSRCPLGSTCSPGDRGGRCEPTLCDPRRLAGAFG